MQSMVVMPGLVPAIHAEPLHLISQNCGPLLGVDARHKAGHDALGLNSMWQTGWLHFPRTAGLRSILALSHEHTRPWPPR
jgi:hypothetical protein